MLPLAREKLALVWNVGFLPVVPLAVNRKAKGLRVRIFQGFFV
jgi:hypothetical protein